MLKSAKEEADSALLSMQAQIIQEEARLNAAKKATAAFIAENNALIEKLQNFLKAVPNLELKAQPVQKKGLHHVQGLVGGLGPALPQNADHPGQHHRVGIAGRSAFSLD